MPIDPLTGALVPDGTTGGFGGLLGSTLAGANPLFNFGAGLLAATGPSLTPQSPWQAIGKGAAYASEAQQKSLENELYRQKIIEGQREQAGLAKIQEFFGTPEGKAAMADNPVLGALLSSGVKPVLEGAATAFANPLTLYSLAGAKADLGAKVAANDQLYNQARAAADSAEYLKSKGPAGEWLLQHPNLASYIPSGMSIAGLLKLDPTEITKLIPGLEKADPKDVKNMLAATATVAGNSAKLLASANIDQSVLSGPPDVQIEAFRNAQKYAETVAESGGKPYDLGRLPKPVYAWQPTTDTAAAPQVQPKAQAELDALATPSPTSTATAPAAAPTKLFNYSEGASAAPAPTPAAGKPAPAVAPVNQETGRPYPVYTREADGDRKVPRGELYLIWDKTIGDWILHRSTGPK